MLITVKLARRVEIRPRHSPNFVRLHNEGYVSWAGASSSLKRRTLRDTAHAGLLGPIFDEHLDTDISKRPFKGSVMVVNEESWEGFIQKVQSDPYIKENIWDLEKAQCIPFCTLMRRCT